MRNRILPAFYVFMILGACSHRNEPTLKDESVLVGTTWAQEGKKGYFTIHGSHIDGRSDCNSFSTSGGRLRFLADGTIQKEGQLELSSTEMLCSSPPSETLSLRVEKWQKYDHTGTTLRIFYNDDEIVTFNETKSE